jgi:hypothetical protein
VGSRNRAQCDQTFSTADLVSGLDLKTFEIKSHNVVKLAGLVDGMARALRVSPSRVRTAAAQLRKHKMLSTGPRGPGALEMTPEDATNLLLAVMYDGELSDAHETVTRLRAASLQYYEGRRSFEDGREKMTSPPKNGFITSEVGETYRLGDVVDILLDAWARFNRIDEGGDEDIDLEPVNLRLEISCPGYNARLTFNTPNGLFWHLNYEWKSPDQLAYEAAGDKMFRATWESKDGPHMWSSRTVGEDSLTKVADCLRGCEWDEDLDEVTPPYEGEALPSRSAVPA